MEEEWELLTPPIFNPAFISLGSGAGNELAYMKLMPEIPVMVLNTNKDDARFACYKLLEQGKPKETIFPILLGYDWLKGKGAGSNIELGLKALEETYPKKIKPLLNTLINKKEVNTIFLLASTGGGTGSNAPELLASLTEDFPNLTIIPFLITPFRCEGKAQLDRAKNAIKWVNRLGYSATVLDNQKAMELYKAKTGVESIEDAMAYMNKWIAEWFNLMFELLTQRSNARLKFDRQDAEILWAKNKEISIVGYANLSPIYENVKVIDELNYLADVSPKSAKLSKSQYASLIALKTTKPKLLNLLTEGLKAKYGEESNFKIFYVEEKRIIDTQICAIISGFSENQLRPIL
ncbi:MAG: hypothetical protein QXT31_03420 [Candidatus Bathyarchaeia archaeon]